MFVSVTLYTIDRIRPTRTCVTCRRLLLKTRWINDHEILQNDTTGHRKRLTTYLLTYNLLSAKVNIWLRNNLR